MPIYAYKCSACGHEQDMLQKMSDAPLKVCPQCGQETFSKQLTAPGFQLKGSGWYVTDFRGGSKSGGAGAASSSSTATSDSASAAPAAPASTAADKPAA